MNKKVAAVIPTFNRKEMLVECLEALASQTYKPAAVYICDNKSTDGTKEYLRQHGYLNEIVNNVSFKYLEMPVNGGGAMGFSVGMETAYEEGYDVFWMMDDDGLPKQDSLENLICYIGEYDFVSPVMYNRDKRDSLVTFVKGTDDPTILDTIYGDKDIYTNYCNPFNGGLYSRRLVEKVGFPKKELFIYGDEMNYHQRCIDAGFPCVGIRKAIHYHPPFNPNGVIFFMRILTFRDNRLTTFCCWRNLVYNAKIRVKRYPVRSILTILYFYFVSTIFFIVVHPSIKWLAHFNKAFFDGLFERWGRQYQFIK